ncbi:CG11321 [Drosophila busckii]|uniref:CG11321 n=1 Tax=Drosophila busckii TaxID=30019 RepID=A0A0M4ENX1_DROBS|nr:CG11321 [Drosophila busckii]
MKMTTPQLLNRNTRTMPAWVNEANQRIGPKPPPPPPNGSAVSNGMPPKQPTLPPKAKNTPEPDYEVIEFSQQQQYSNEPMKATQTRTKTPGIQQVEMHIVWLTESLGHLLGVRWTNLLRQLRRHAVEQGTPPIPPKAQAGGAAPPVAPPRRSKRGLLTPFLGRKDQMLPPPSPTPSHKSIGAWRGTAPPPPTAATMMNNRPLPEPPRPAPSEAGGSSRSATPKSVFDAIQRPPSVQLEKIKSKASATLDRMAQLQQRYRQQKAQHNGGQSSMSTASSEMHLPNGGNFEHWSNISPSPSHFRSGSMSSGLNSSHFDLSDDSHNFHNSLLFQQQQRQAAGAQRRQMSTSVFNLNTMNRRPLAETQNGGQWLANQRMQQAQSLAQLNCAGCQSQQAGAWPQHQHPHAHPDDWSQFGSQQQFNHSNLSLNMGHGYLPQQQHPHYPPPVFMTQRGIMPQMYPGAAGYPMMHPGVMGMPPTSASRATSRARYAASPTPSRKSMSLRRKRSSYVDDELTDDEDSDQDDRRSLVSNRSGMTSASRAHLHHQRQQRRLSSASQLINTSGHDEMDAEQRGAGRQRNRRGSIAKSVQSEWLPERRDSNASGGGTLKRSTGEPQKTSRIYSDLESEGSDARALVQAKIQQKLQEAEKEKHKAKKAAHKPKPEMKDENTQAAAVVPKAVQATAPAKAVDSASEYEEIVEEVTATESEEEAEAQAVTEAAEDELGPPPSTPDHEWECEFCTFVNEPNIKICAICCKTPCKPPIKPKEKAPAKPETKLSSQPDTKLVRKSSLKSVKPQEQPKSSISKPKTTTTTTTSTAAASTSTAAKKPTTDTKSKPKATASTDTHDKPLGQGFIHKESVENIWNTLDESIQAQAEQVLQKAKKVSTACGGTPPRELPPPAREMGTSPPPQSISTQTYDALPFDAPTQQPQELPAAVQERYRTPEPAKLERQPYYRSSSQLTQDERYRSSNDLRLNHELNPGQFTRRPNFISDLKILQHQTSSPFDLPHDSLGHKQDQARDPEIEMHIILKELELYKFTVEELEVALKYCTPDLHPIQWLRENWHKLVQTVQSLSTKYGQEKAENTIGTVSQNEAREALRRSGGNVWQAVADCIQQRQQKYRKLAAKGNFLSEDIVNALTAHQGNVEQALLELNRTQLKPFLMRIWGSPNGVENESVAIDSKSGTMEQNQAKQNQEVLRSIETMLETFKGKPEQDYETDPEVMRILTKSPINTPRSPQVLSGDKGADDVKNFVWQHIQDIVPNLVQQVEQELMETTEVPAPAPIVSVPKEATPPPAVDPDTYIMEEVIKPNLREASIREELPPNYIYATEIANFKLEFDRGVERMHELEWQPDNLEDAEHIIYKGYLAPQEQVPEQIEQALEPVVIAAEVIATSTVEPAMEITQQVKEQAPEVVETAVAQSQNVDTQIEAAVDQQDELNDKPSTSRDAGKRNKRSRRGRARDQSQRPINRDKLTTTNAEPVTKLSHNTNEQQSTNAAAEEAEPKVMPAEVEAATSKVLSNNSNEHQTTNLKELEAQTKVIPTEAATAEINNEQQTNTLMQVETKAAAMPAEVEVAESEVLAMSIAAQDIDIEAEPNANIMESDQVEFVATEATNIQVPIANIIESNQEEVVPTEEAAVEVIQLAETNIVIVADASVAVVEPEIALITDEPQTQIDLSAIEGEVATETTATVTETEPVSTISQKRSPKRFSKIPVRTSSMHSLRSESRASTHTPTTTEADTSNAQEETEAIASLDTNLKPPAINTEDTQTVVVTPTGSEETYEDANEFHSSEEPRMHDESPSDTELYSLDSDEQAAPSSQSEIVLMLNEAEPTTEDVGLLKSNSNETLSSHSSHSVSDKLVLKEFVPSGDPAKQNLSELVEDTQRLIKQMREEISMDEFESSDEDYSDYSDEYDEGEEEEWYDSEGEEEGTYNEQMSYIEDASSGAAELEGDDEATEIEDIIEEDEEEYEDEEQTVATETHSPIAEPLDTVTSPSLSVTPTNHEQVLSADPENISFTASNVVRSAIETVEPAVVEAAPIVPIESRPAELPVEIVLEPVEVETLPEPEALPITPTPTIADSESRPLEPPTETVLEEPKKVNIKTATQSTSSQANSSTSKPSSSSSSNNNITPKAAKSTVSKIPKPKTEPTTKNPINKNLPLRSKSFSAPMGISSVKRIQQEFLQKQSQLSAASNSRVPLKTSATNKKSLSEAISKFNTAEGPSTSGAAAAAAALLKQRTQPRIPKKKYHETCFSDDDYETSEAEEEEEQTAIAAPLKAEQLKRKLSMPVFRAYPSVQEPVIEEPAILARKYVEQQLVTNLAEAQIAATLVNMKFGQDVALWAAKECADLDQAISMLQQECELCMNTYPMNQIVSMLKCTHKCCKQCAKSYFTVQITDRSINDCSCPFCKLPELSNISEHEDEHLEYFSNLDIFLKSILDNDVHELFQRKLRDRTLLQDPNFKWCIQCSSGFFARPKQKRLICPDCGSVTCGLCRKPWEREHEGTSCEAYLEWKQQNDPELQAQGVQEHLATNGIDCPKCKFRYSLARGGCMHFTCTQCKFEFCYGCARPFMMGAKCNISPYCAKLGLHAHHPRNCLFYLRDKIPLQLQFMLKEHKVIFDTEPVEAQDEPSSSSKARALARCPIPLQKETPQGLVDTVCNSDVPDKHAGMCRTHYVEYLAAKVAKASIDPLPIFDLTDCVQELRRRGIALPERGPWDTDEIYKNMCSEVIKQRIPLKSA